MLNLETVLQFLKYQLPVGVTYISIAYAIFHFFGTRFIENRFAIKLVSAKAELDEKIEIEKARLNRMTAQELKLKEKQYTILPKILNQFNNIFYLISELINSINSDDQNFEDYKYSQEHYDEISKNTEIRIIPGRGVNFELGIIYSDKTIEYLDSTDVNIKKLRIYFLKKSIFLPTDQKTKIEGLISCLSLITNDIYVYTSFLKSVSGQNLLSAAQNKLKNEAQPNMSEIEELVRKIIFPESHG